MKTFVFCGNYSDQILKRASSLGKTYWSVQNNLREMLQKIPVADVVFIRTGHMDIEMLEDSPRLKGIVCSEDIRRNLEISAVSALGIVMLPMPVDYSYSSEWEMLFETLQQMFLGHHVSSALNPDVYHHPDWSRAKI